MSESLWKQNFLLSIFGFWKIPLLFFCRPKIVYYDAEKTIVKIPLNRRTKNHLNSMYFGALAVGADIAGGYHAYSLIRGNKTKVSLVFKEFKAEFLSRPEQDVLFVCEEGNKISEGFQKTLKTKERENIPLFIKAVLDNQEKTEVAHFWLTLSLKARD